MTLAVDPTDLTGFTTLVHRAAQGFRTALRFLAGHTVIDCAVAATTWGLAHDDHLRHLRAARETLTRFGALLDASRRELDETARWYRSVTPREAQEFDAAYPGTRRGPLPRQRPSGSTSFQDVCDATAHLKPSSFPPHLQDAKLPPAERAVRTPYDVDVPGTVAHWLTGDWRGYLACADAWDRLGDFCDASAKNIRHGNDVLGLTWRGHAADAAWRHFERLATALEAAGDTFHSLREHYAGIAETVFSFAALARNAVARICARPTESAVAEYRELVNHYENVLVEVATAVGTGGCLTQFMADDLKRFPTAAHAHKPLQGATT
ncbi:hypothetical protein [Streptomyces xanthii]|uniref:Uncharacterized protein n=1 Tax=Streptomyces xanthii TaxID=2768069 RepID=A0A7H1B5I4_9ACTN|nr:hypothetical protein [Streptomyces xanthii]QNS03989.1 hypothetical protein IAG42_10380 [Streptomyces xanthii]